MEDRNSEFLTQGRLWPFLHSRGNGGMWGLQQFSRQTISWPLFVIHISFFFRLFYLGQELSTLYANKD